MRDWIGRLCPEWWDAEIDAPKTHWPVYHHNDIANCKTPQQHFIGVGYWSRYDDYVVFASDEGIENPYIAYREIFNNGTNKIWTYIYLKGLDPKEAIENFENIFMENLL